MDCDGLSIVEIPERVSNIGHRAFKNCIGLTLIKLLGDTFYETDTFEGCGNLSKVLLPNAINKIREYAFKNFQKLTNIDIPDGVREIGVGAFEGCTSLISIRIPNSVKFIGDGVFLNCCSLKEIHFRHYNPSQFCWCFKNLFGYDYDLSKLTIYVPIGSEYDYRHNPFFSDFENILSEK